MKPMKIRLCYIFLFLLVFCFQAKAQTYGNEWINYGQKYYRFSIVQTGVYRIDYAQLSSAGIPTAAFSSSNLQIFGREKEIPLYLVDGNDNSLDSGDYILFYAEKNDGWLDSTLYPNPDKIGNPAYSLYNDTINYFLTWNSASNNLRFAEETDSNFSAYTPIPFISWNYTEEYHASYFEGESLSDISTSFFNDLEGFSAGAVVGPYNYGFSIPTGNIYTGTDAPNAQLQWNSFGSNNEQNTNGFLINHHLQHTVGPSDSVLMDSLYYGITGIQFKTTLSPGSLTSGSSIFKWKNIGDLPVSSDRQGWSYFSLTFSRKKFEVSNQLNQTKIRLDLTWSSVNPILFSFGDIPRKLNGVFDGNSTVQALLPNNLSANTQKIVYTDAQNKRFKIMYPGAFELDGKYTLLVQGSDKSGNLSGDLDYRITFEIVRESTITKLMNYPNPFCTSTRFVFTLTGSEVPDDMIIQIMTVTGKVIREITENEFGPIYIGRNISQFS
jgi:hypothetical protein